MPLKKLANIVGDAQRDAAIARRSANDPDFQRKVQKDRRGTLSRFATVKAALRDRERIEKAKAAKAKPKKRS
ncbi:MAG TPA: hypothetical protein VFW12_02595 [Candidatus Limnocylindria bacterium]|nr:hypothetical protein [Candidatus Limnocylindria bacterium]